MNDACVLLGKPNVYGSIFRFEGQISLFDEKNGPCYRCLYPDPPPPELVPSCAEAGVLGVLPGIVGTIQAAEAIKLIAGIGQTLTGRLLLFDALRMSFREMKLPKRCHEHAPITELIDYEGFCNPLKSTDITATELAAKIATGEEVVLIDVREPYEWSAGHLENARHIPMQQIPGHLAELPRDRELVMICRSGSRSANVQQFLMSQGFTKVKNLVGGMRAWSRDVDPKIHVA